MRRQPVCIHLKAPNCAEPASPRTELGWSKPRLGDGARCVYDEVKPRKSRNKTGADLHELEQRGSPQGTIRVIRIALTASGSGHGSDINGASEDSSSGSADHGAWRRGERGQGYRKQCTMSNLLSQTTYRLHITHSPRCSKQQAAQKQME
jgi:hypothetical protein